MRKIAIFLVLVLVSFCFYNPNFEVKANDFIVDSEVRGALVSDDNIDTIFISDTRKGVELKNLKISNTKVCVFHYNESTKSQIHYPDDMRYIGISVKLKSIGTSYVSGDIYFDGKFIKSFSTMVYVYKYKNPFKKFKINKKSYKKKFKKHSWIYIKGKHKKKYKLNIQVKKGWKIDYIDITKGSKCYGLSRKSTVKLSKSDDQYVNIGVKNKKQKSYEVYGFDFEF